MCKVLEVSRSSYYEWIVGKTGKWDRTNEALGKHVRKFYELSRKTYGSPRVAIALREQGIIASRPRVAQLMKALNLQSIIRKKWISTTQSKHKFPVVENKLNRAFMAESEGQAWVSDLTYIKTNQGRLYYTVIIDLFDRKVVGWSFSKTMRTQDTTMVAWKMAVKNRPIRQQLIFHSDRGIQYACHEFANLLKSYRLVERSMSRKGNCWDNAVSESFFKTLKVEHVYHKKYKTYQEAQ
jgi:transposase InsO family protein